MPGTSPSGEFASVPKLRLLLAAWGRRHIDLFCRYCLPSLLAPGNIPALSGSYDVEFLVLTRNEDFDLYDEYPSMKELGRHCAIRFLAIDDVLMPTRFYGFTLTLAYARGIIDSCDDITKVTYIFLNADFFFSDGSFRSVVRALSDGYNAVVAPSFRCVAEDFVAFIDRTAPAGSSVLAFPPRGLAKQGIDMMHPTFQAKVVTQNYVSTELANQFLWQVDSDTMIGRFYLMFMLCIKPETPISRVSGYCDYTFIPDMCPSGKVMVIGDSDDVFILELQHRIHEIEYISFAPWKRDVLAKKIAEWTTATHRRYATVDCFIHARELPAGTARVAAEADAFIKDLSKDLPAPVPHDDHPYWTGTLIHALRMQIDGFRIIRGPDALDESDSATVEQAPVNDLIKGTSALAKTPRWMKALADRICASRCTYIGIWHPDWLDFQLVRRWIGQRLKTVDHPILFLTTVNGSPVETMLRRVAGDRFVAVRAAEFAEWLSTCRLRFGAALYECDAADLDLCGRHASMVAPLMMPDSELGLFVRATGWPPLDPLGPVSMADALHRIRSGGQSVEVFGAIAAPRKSELRQRLLQRRMPRATVVSISRWVWRLVLDVLRVAKNNWHQRDALSNPAPRPGMSSILWAVSYARSSGPAVPQDVACHRLPQQSARL